MKFISVTLSLISVCVFAQSRDTTFECPSLGVCIEHVYEFVKSNEPGLGLSPREQAVVQQLTSFGEAAAPNLVGMLADPDIEVAQLAAAALRNIEHIDPVFLPQIIVGLDRNLGWLPPALGRINSPEAAKEAVARYLVSECAPHNQEAYAVKLSGNRAIPYIVDAARCANPCGQRDHDLLGHILGGMPEERSKATAGLLAIVLDNSTATETARGVLHMISFLGRHGLAIEDDLLELRKTKPELAAAIDKTLVGIESSASVEVLTRWLELNSSADATVSILRDIAALGPSASDAGPTIVSFLRDQNWDLRNASARALGFIQYRASAGELIQLLSAEEEDVRFSWIVAESLGRMRAAQASEALSRLVSSHWYPPVRRAAATALENIDSGTSYESRYPKRYFGREFFTYDNLHTGEDYFCDISTQKATPESSQEKLRIPTHRSLLEKLTYKRTIISSQPKNKPPPADGNNLEIAAFTGDNVVENVKKIDEVPETALRVEEGWLVGTDRGEWGGELAYVHDQGTSTIILDENVQDIYRLGERYIAVTGLSHGFSRGAIYEVSRQDNRTWTAQRWRALPRAPESSFLVHTDELLVKVEVSGSILVSATGSMRMAVCDDSNMQ